MTLTNKDPYLSRKIAILKAKRNILEDSTNLEDLIEGSASIEDLNDVCILFSLNLSKDFADRVFKKLDSLLDNLPTSSLTTIKVVTKQLQEKINTRIFLNKNFVEVDKTIYDQSKVDLKDIAITLTEIPSDDFTAPNILIKTPNNKLLSDNGKFDNDLVYFRRSLNKWHLDKKINLEELDSFAQIFNSWRLVFCEYKVDSFDLLATSEQIRDLIDLFKPESNYFKDDFPTLEMKLIENLEILECFPKNLEELVLAYPEYYPHFLLSNNEYLRNLASSLKVSRFDVSLEKEKVPNKIQQELQKSNKAFKGGIIDLDSYKRQVEIVMKEVEGFEEKDLETYLKYLKLSLAMLDLPMDQFASKDLVGLIDKLEEAQNTIKNKTQQQLTIPYILHYFKQIHQKATNSPDVLLANSAILLFKQADFYQKIFIKIVKDLNIEYLSKIIQNQNFEKAR